MNFSPLNLSNQSLRRLPVLGPHRELTDGPRVVFCQSSSGSCCNKCVSSVEACGVCEGKQQVVSNTLINGQQRGAAGATERGCRGIPTTPGRLRGFDVASGGKSTDPPAFLLLWWDSGRKHPLINVGLPRAGVTLQVDICVHVCGLEMVYS